ncbi:unnamed protein product [Phytophthora fragariaefolia]|uniref:Unnamed protein product n=1 Tax=Phytophthora fragariaefolia TaxID=1490495 RepID=A0A9W6TVE4_9STRA|nr:unnamed protein product [Phytophthora fragariaefolia]
MQRDQEQYRGVLHQAVAGPLRSKCKLYFQHFFKVDLVTVQHVASSNLLPPKESTCYQHNKNYPSAHAINYMQAVSILPSRQCRRFSIDARYACMDFGGAQEPRFSSASLTQTNASSC